MVKNLIDQKFGRLTVISDMGRDSQRHQCWDCLCECGETRAVNHYNLISGRTKSCGCINRERLKVMNKKNTTKK